MTNRMLHTEEWYDCRQKFQDARAWARRWKALCRRYRWDYHEAMSQYNAQQERACNAEAENKRLREALGMVEWVRDEDLPEYDEWCPWCGNYRRYGHSYNCMRQAALEPSDD